MSCCGIISIFGGANFVVCQYIIDSCGRHFVDWFGIGVERKNNSEKYLKRVIFLYLGYCNIVMEC